MAGETKGIVQWDDGLYRDAKAAGLHAMFFTSREVMKKLAADGKDCFGRDIDVRADLRQHVDRTLKRFRVDDDGSNRAEMVKQFAADNYGLMKEFEARDINPKRQMGEKLFVPVLNTPLFPQFIANAFIEGRISAGLVSELTYTDVQIDRLSYDKVRLTESQDDRQMRNVAIGGDLPVTQISQIGSNVPLRKFGRLFRYANEVMRVTPLDVIARFVRRIGQQIALDETDEVIEVLHAGDGEANTAVTDTTPATDGTLVYADLVKLELAFANSYSSDVWVADGTSFQTILNFAEYKNPLGGYTPVRTNGIPSVPSPSKMARIYRWSSAGSTFMAEASGRIAAVDSTGAGYVIRNGDVLEEQGQVVSAGRTEVALSYMMGVVKGDTGAFQSLDVLA